MSDGNPLKVPRPYELIDWPRFFSTVGLDTASTDRLTRLLLIHMLMDRLITGVQVGGKLVIGEKGVVNATVETVDAIILGCYDGNMTFTGNVEIAATGRVRGNIKTDSLVIAKGGYFKGNVAKINEEPAATLRPLYLIEDKLAQQIGPR